MHTPEHIGREADHAAVRARLAQARLVTLIGPPGVGKSALAASVARDWRASLRDVVWLDLHGAADACAVLSETLDGAPLAARAPGLIVADGLSAEQAPGLLACLDGAPRARVLVTSRERLRVAGEVVHPLAPLAPHDAVRLLAQRALAAGAPAPDPEALTRLARRLDGLPLAIELAAPQLAFVPPDALADRLTGSLAMLSGGLRDGPAHHRTLDAALAMSVDALPPPERDALVRLACLPAGFGLAEAEVVLGAGAGATVARLAERSLVAADGQGGFRVYEVLRTHLRASEVHAEVMDRLLDHAAHAEASALARRTAADWALQAGGDRLAAGLAAAAGLGPSAETLQRLDALLAATEATPTALAARAACLLRLGRYADALSSAEAAGCAGTLVAAHALRRLGRAFEADAIYSAALAEVPGDRVDTQRARLLGNRAGLALERGDPAQARLLLRQALHDPGAAPLEGALRSTLGLAAHEEGRLDEAESEHLRALALHHRSGDTRFVAIGRFDLGVLRSHAGRLREALTDLDAAVEGSTATGDWRQRLLATAARAGVHARLGQAARAQADARAVREVPEGALDAAAARAVDLHLAVLHVAGIWHPDPEAAQRVLGDPDADHAVGDEARLARRTLAAALGLHHAPDAVSIAVDGTRVDAVDLSARAPVARLVACLLDAQLRGQPHLDADALIAGAWPGERVAAASARNRLNVALSTLRKLGPDGLVARSEQGWRLDRPVRPVGD